MDNNSTNSQSSIDNGSSNNLDDLLSIYSQANEIQRYEGSGIWSRFNILVSLNIVLFGVVTFAISSKLALASTIIKIVSIAGCLLTLWAIYVLRRLWLWHRHWKEKLQDIEGQFPAHLPKLFSSCPDKLKKNSAWYQSWILSYTQPFMMILLGVWTALSVAAFNGGMKVDNESKDNKESIEYNINIDLNGINHECPKISQVNENV